MVAGLEVDRLYDGSGVKLEEYSQDKPAVVTLDGKVSYPAAALDRSVSQPFFTSDGHLAYLVSDDRNEYPIEVDLAGDGTKRLLTQPGTVAGWDVAGGRMAMLYTDDEHPGEIYAL